MRYTRLVNSEHHDMTSGQGQGSTRELRRVIGFWGGIGVMVGVIIGSGIFRTPSSIAAELPSPWIILLLWLAGGLLCLAGAFTYAELASMFPSSGGVYVFIREGFGDCPAFVFGWAYLVLIKPFAAGGIAIVFAENLLRLINYQGSPESTQMWVKIITTAALLALTIINWRGVRLATGVSGVLTAIKIAALVALVGLTLVVGLLMGKVDVGGLAQQGAVPTGGAMLTAIAAVMAGVLWTYDGWADVGSVAGEVKNPQRTLPLIYITGTGGIIALYLAVNAAYYAVVPVPELLTIVKEQPTTPIAALVIERLLGPAAGASVALVVMLSTLGSSHASVMTGARVSYAQARDGLMFKFIGHVHPKYHTPDAALFSQVLLAIVAVWFLGSFQKLAEGFVFTMWIFYAMAGLTIFVMRVRKPEMTRAFRCPGYPVVPAVFVLCALGMTAMSIASDPKGTAMWLGVLAIGVPVYYGWRAIVRRA
jgi:basic amino acid/polyamine antiporter, APA family